MKTKFLVYATLIALSSINLASACVIAVEGNLEESLFKNAYGMHDLKLTTDTSSADVGIKVVYQSESQTSSDPVFGSIKTTTIYKRSADIYERGSVVASTGSHPISEVGQGAAFARDLRRALSKAGCSL
ncbi:MAG: hypothetical protein H0V66_06480 [Bdellovibrionales bacterium]|nr:hypothetical protein [Bdellovibrionales bacterium]